MDDKHAVKVGEPGYPLAGVERGKQVLVSSAKTFAVADHDFTKFSLIPSVNFNFFVNIHKSITGSFYTGRVHVTLKENALQPSSPIRHMTELKDILCADTDNHPGLLLYTDGGPDHWMMYATVQMSLICLFLALDLVFLCTVHTLPYHTCMEEPSRTHYVNLEYWYPVSWYHAPEHGIF